MRIKTMKAKKVLHKQLKIACPQIHSVRLAALLSAVGAAITEHETSVTALGRNLKSQSKTTTKHDIKRMDRLIGNVKLHNERQLLYRYLAHQLIGQQKHPVLLADWSPIPGKDIFQLLRISIPMGGRSLTIYEQCFKEEKLNNSEVHKQFLKELSELLPPTCQPIILADAIFKTPWFQSIEQLGWYWIGRVRGQVRLSLNGKDFLSCNQVMSQARQTPTSLGQVYYSKSKRFVCLGTLYHGTIKGKHKLKKRGGISMDSKDKYYSTKAKQPWLLVSRLPEPYQHPKKVVALYRCRMQIEEGFRDTKNTKYGIGLAQAKSQSAMRYDNLLLVAALALYLLWCIGCVARHKKFHYQLQANTTRNKTVLSIIYLAMQVIDDKRYKIKKKELIRVMENLSLWTQTADEISF
jgi:hypothetical protein